MVKLADLNFDNSFARLGDEFYTEIQPQGFNQPELVAANPDAAALLELDPAELETPEFLQWLSGNHRLPRSRPLAMVYSGHQFGTYVPQLGDGRGLLIGEVVTGDRWDLHLKGAGQTPYSRFADGRAVLRSSIREYLCSEALAGLGIPTTRALAIAGSDEPVYRETVETGAMLMRLARSHVRFGSFEYFYYQNHQDAIQQLADYCIRRHLPGVSDTNDRYAALFHNAVVSTAELIAQWQAVGFCHGVMNTDNMSIIGETLDFGPFGFMEAYDPAWICNHSDHGGRYAYNQQPAVGLWNCNALAHAFSPLLGVAELKAILREYEPVYLERLMQLQRCKLGLQTALPEDSELIEDLLELLRKQRVDYTIFFRRLCDFETGNSRTPVRDLFPDRSAFDAWGQRYRRRLSEETLSKEQRRGKMLAANPKYILRNYMAEIAIRKARDEGEFGEIEHLRRLLAEPFEEHPDSEHYAGHPPDWADSLAVSCSS